MGLGPIGQRLVQYLAERDGIRLVGAIDIDPGKAGQDAGLLSGTRRLEVEVSSAAAEVLARPAEVVLVTTGSELARIEPQLAMCVQAGKSVVSTCEELAFPFESDPDAAARLDALARQHQVSILATGVNPGLLMDALPVFLSSACQRVTGVRVERHQDAAIRRLPFQQKIGAGLTPAEFEAKRQAGSIRHVGFAQSVGMIARALGWRLDRFEEQVRPVVAERAVASRFIEVKPGQCAGLHQLGIGYVGSEERITLELQAYLGHPAPRDTVVLHGRPEIRSTVEGGVDGDVATCAMVLNALKAVLRAAPGLRTMADVPLTHWYAR
jgi:4-hydroxy-tetrahydrodipicolinate reductase